MKIQFLLDQNDSPSVAAITVQSMVANGYAIEIIALGRSASDASVKNLQAMAARPAARNGKKVTVTLDDMPTA